MRTRNAQTGLTLVELMVALAVAIVLLAVGIPTYQGLEANNRAASQSQALVTALSLARSEAIGRGIPVSVCARSTDTACGPSTSWANGWLVFTDAAGTAGVLDGADEVIKVFEAPRGRPTIAPTPTTVAALVFNSRGEQAGANPLEARLQLDQANTTAGQTRCVRVGPSGQVISERKVCT